MPIIEYESRLKIVLKRTILGIKINLLLPISHSRLPFVIRLDLGSNQTLINVIYGYKNAINHSNI
jgi:hypothetical protein